MALLQQKTRGVEGGGTSFELDTNLLGGNEATSKISIMAPPGAIVQLNGKNIIIGKSGIYDFDNDLISITSIVFPASQNYGADRYEYRSSLQKLKEELQKACTDASTLAQINATTGIRTPEDSATRKSRDDRAKKFCNTILTIYTQYISTINDYRSVQDDANGGNENLSNVIVNYIIN